MTMKFNEEQLFQLLDLYEAHDCLWNISSANYKNRIAREEALIDILNHLDIPHMNIYELKNKLKSLRTTYNQELGKIRKSVENGNYIYKPQLVWFERMDKFIRHSYDYRKQTKNDKDHGAKPTEESSSLTKKEVNIDLIVKDIDVEEIGDDSCETEVKHEIILDRKSLLEPPKKKLKPNDSLQSLEKSLTELKDCLSQKFDKEESEFEIFGRHVGAQLKKMPLTSALNLQLQIQQLIANERLRLEQSSDSINFLN